MLRAVNFAGQPLDMIKSHRKRQAEFWKQQAVQLLPKTLEVIQAVKDEHLRKFFLRDVPPGTSPKLGQEPHFALWSAMLKTAGCKNINLVQDMVNGFPLIGAIAASNEWEVLVPKPWSFHPTEELAFRARGTRQRVHDKLKAGFKSMPRRLSEAIWSKSLENVKKGVTMGPYTSENEVSSFFGTDTWIAMPMFPVEQHSKIRPADDGSAGGSGANNYSHMTEKLEVPNMDGYMSVVRELHRRLGTEELGGWTEDESNAFRQVAIRPEDRRVAVVVMSAVLR